MFDKLKQMLSKIDADYADIRYELQKETDITFHSKELSNIGANTTDGFVIRVLNNGGMASITFTKESDAEKAIKLAVEQSHLLAKNMEKPAKLAPAEVIKDTYIRKLEEHPKDVSIDEKLQLIKNYNDIALNYKKVVATELTYVDLLRERYFVNTEGTEIREDLVTTRVRGLITSKEGNLLQNIRVGFGGSGGFGHIRNQEAVIEGRTKIVLDLLNAEPVKAGVYNVILNPSMSGVFAHEAFGHFSEADIVEDLPGIRQKMKLGEKLGSDAISITDNAPLPNQLGFYKYDDEGVPVRKVELMKNGILTSRLHSRRTAAEFDEPITGHCVAQDFRFAPIVRMGTIFVEPGENTFEDLTTMVGDGLYLLDPKGGQTSGDNFTFGAQYGYFIKNGKVDKMIRDINISGNLYETLKNIQAVGDDLVLAKTGGCGKGQMNWRSTHGGAHMLVNKLVLGGV